jgi:FkbM family methyltransferase
MRQSAKAPPTTAAQSYRHAPRNRNSMSNLVRKVGKAAMYYLSRPSALFERERVIQTADGVSMLCVGENYIERTIAETGVWEQAETASVRIIVRPGQVCLDIGANVGYFSLLMAKLGATVHAYEPTSYGFNRMTANIALNPQLATRIFVNNQGLSDKSFEFEEALEARFSSRILAHSDPEKISFKTLDSVWTGPLHFLKIDVDGHDTAVIRGGMNTLRAHKPVVLAEFCDRVLQTYNSSVADLARAFIECGYSRCKILETNEDTSLEAFATEQRASDRSSRNLLLVP